MNLSDLIGQKEPKVERPEQMSKEDYAAMKQQQREELWADINTHAQEVCGNGESMKSFLDFTAGCTPQSVRNLLLLHLQDDTITQPRTFDQWKRMGRSILSGADGYTFMIPQEYTKEDGTKGHGYNIGKVFDIKQTRGRQPQPQPPKNIEELIGAIVDKSPVRLEISDQLPDNVQAQYVPRGHTVYVRDGMEAVPTFLALAREMSHANLDFRDGSYSRQAFSSQAYCATYIVAKRFGVDVSGFSFDKVCQKYRDKPPEELRALLGDIKSAAYSINRHISNNLGEMEQTLEQDAFDMDTKTKQSKGKTAKEQLER